MNIETIYEDENLVVINKPAGMMVHGDGRSKEETISDWFSQKYEGVNEVGEHIQLENGEEIKRPGVVHRLDKDTTGVLVLAKNQETFLNLKEQFKERNVEKIYNAFVYGEVKSDEDTIDRPIGRSSKDFRLRSAQRGARGEMREAETYYNVLNRGGGFTFLEMKPKTGRTHQLRVHMKAINYPIVCDKLYAPKQECALGFDRLALHASSIEFEVPDKEKMLFVAELPEDFKKAKKELNFS